MADFCYLCLVSPIETYSQKKNDPTSKGTQMQMSEGGAKEMTVITPLFKINLICVHISFIPVLCQLTISNCPSYKHSCKTQALLYCDFIKIHKHK